MTAYELADRITMDEVAEWSVVASLEAEERETERKKAELRAKVQDGIGKARGRLRAKRAA